MNTVINMLKTIITKRISKWSLACKWAHCMALYSQPSPPPPLHVIIMTDIKYQAGYVIVLFALCCVIVLFIQLMTNTDVQNKSLMALSSNSTVTALWLWAVTAQLRLYDFEQ